MRGTRNSPIHLVRSALRKPGLIPIYLRRRIRNRRIRRSTSSHPEFYRAVMDDDIRQKTARGAVGTRNERGWLAVGKLQFDYLVSHGLEPRHRLLEIGCGNLRAGWRFIEWLDEGNYVGVDISSGILLDALETIASRDLGNRGPSVVLFDGLNLKFLRDGSFDVIHAHSVFTHTPSEVTTALLGEACRLLKPGGFFDFTFNRSETGEIWNFLDEDFYYPVEFLVAMASDAGLDAQPAIGWHYKQEKLRAVKPRG